ncbi:lytic transglycosylase domain-containing protein [Tropicimonas sp. IMCC34043]|uniref:lytic transglycosylase domain-containing protein n=1 Tax=Tropicimonas sp. IMCC34043 TaxID=2248760 RepID=UPI000E25F53B|nr:lytic transglycosylase domain-containing protein [Tropicimonas sp. IMCC34043]
MRRRPTLAAFVLLATLALGACAGHDRVERRQPANFSGAGGPLYPNETPELRQLINHYCAVYQVPPDLVHRLAIRESSHNPTARNGPYYGLLQILPQTARTMGHSGPPTELLDADTNLKYGVKYLRGAWLLSDGSYDRAISWYASGYYYEAKRRGMLEETGLR